MSALAFAAALYGVAFGIVGTYLTWLWRTRDVCAPPPQSGTPYPHVLIVVPLFNEAPLVIRKLANLAALAYPADRLRVVLADGGSTDGTVERAADWIRGRGSFELLRGTARNKTAQLNAALRLPYRANWILVTDADALLARDTLERLIELVAGDPRLGVVGVPVTPHAAHALERLYWRLSDWAREREYARGSASIVAAPCYLAHRSLLADLPDDTIADDVYVSCRAAVAGRRVGFVSVRALELRAPRTVAAMVRHKRRKADAYLREVLRFLPHVRRMPRPVRTIFLGRAAALTVAPAAAVMASLLLLTTEGMAAGLVDHVAPPVVACALGLCASSRGRTIGWLATLGVILAGVAAWALTAYPFSRQTASFPKIFTRTPGWLSGDAQ